MKQLLSLISIFFIGTSTFAQGEIRLSEEMQTFALGSKNAIVVNIPYANKEIVEKYLRSELKDWGGKYDSKGEEFFTIQAQTKFMGPKPFDTYAKIISTDPNNFKVAFAIDLGGAFMNSREHKELFNAMAERIRTFAKETALKCVEKELDTNKDYLSDLEKTQRGFEKDKKDLEEDIESYKKKIAEAENKIKLNEENQSKQKEAIKNQEKKVGEIESKLKQIK